MINPLEEYFSEDRTNRPVNTLFGGTFTMKKTEKKNYSDLPFDTILSKDQGIDNYIMRNTGLFRKVRKNVRTLEALTNAKTYIEERNTQLADAVKILRTTFADEFQALLNRGYTQEEAAEEAMKEVEHKKKQLYLEIDEQYPMDLDDRVLPKEQRILPFSKTKKKTKK